MGGGGGGKERRKMKGRMKERRGDSSPELVFFLPLFEVVREDQWSEERWRGRGLSGNSTRSLTAGFFPLSRDPESVGKVL